MYWSYPGINAASAFVFTGQKNVDGSVDRADCALCPPQAADPDHRVVQPLRCVRLPQTNSSHSLLWQGVRSPVDLVQTGEFSAFDSGPFLLFPENLWQMFQSSCVSDWMVNCDWKHHNTIRAIVMAGDIPVMWHSRKHNIPLFSVVWLGEWNDMLAYRILIFECVGPSKLLIFKRFLTNLILISVNLSFTSTCENSFQSF